MAPQWRMPYYKFMTTDRPYSPEMQSVLDPWQLFFEDTPDWRALVKDIEPKRGGCGLVYELPNPLLDRQSESVAIADMSDIAYTTPHYHDNGEAEIYIGLAGVGNVVIGEQAYPIERGTALVTLSGIAHYAIRDPRSSLVVAVINTPPFNPQNNIELDPTVSNPTVHFDAEQFARMTGQGDAA